MWSTNSVRNHVFDFTSFTDCFHLDSPRTVQHSAMHKMLVATMMSNDHFL